MSQRTVPDKDLVRNADDMGVDIFARHMTVRHLDSLGGLNYLTPDLDEYMEEMYRTFHDKLHSMRVDLEHEHANS
jgi:hypothetical protein